MATKLFLHRDATTVGGTLPADTASISATAPTWTPGQTNSVVNTPLLTNFSMDTTIGVSAQTSLAYTTDNVITDQKQPMLRFVSETLAAQSIANQTIGVQLGLQESNLLSNVRVTLSVCLWRPGTGSIITRLMDVGAFSTNEPSGTTEENSSGSSAGSTSATAQAGDVLIFELWRDATIQGMTTSYTNTFYYDGTVDGSATDNAAYLLFNTDNLTFQAAGPADPWPLLLPGPTRVRVLNP